MHQTEERLYSLALIRINYNAKVDVETICKMLIGKNRRTVHSNMLFYKK